MTRWQNQTAPAGRPPGFRSTAADLALRADGTWRVIELGDGQVSDRPSATDPAAFLRTILSWWHTPEVASPARH